MKLLIKNLPFIGIIILNTLSEASMNSLQTMRPIVIIINLILISNLLIAAKMKISTYFMFGITGITVLGGVAVFFIPNLGQFYLEHIVESLYLGLFIVAFFPPLFKMAPFTFEFSKKDYPQVVTRGEVFLKIKLILNYLRALLLAISLFLTIVSYHPDKTLNIIFSSLAPILLLLGVGLPVTKKLPKYLIQLHLYGIYRY